MSIRRVVLKGATVITMDPALGDLRCADLMVDGERERALELLGSLGLAARADDACGTLSQIELRKLELARALAVEPRLLVADEAMAGLSAEEVDEVLEILLALAGRGIAVIMIEHIMRAIMRFSQRVLCIVSGKLIADGVSADVVRHPEVQRAYIGD
ncbi:hypothetical protein P5W99_37525 [Paraburkholderia sp. A3BS-1L]|uniref:ABC transporter ATP-binding protein C-terminal domain-containing protein n=1 Tax=Paraburkholderia sp. A3BS-1L TaxID=3028375 RepID=UPI003DA8B53A